MKNPERVAALLAELRTLAETDFERHRIDVLERDLTAPPTPEVVDDKHQRFTDIVFSEQRNGRFVRSLGIHQIVWSHFNGEIPEGFVIHHVDGNPSNNTLGNLQLVTKAEHERIHILNGTKLEHKKQIFICEMCGHEYLSMANCGSKYCSDKCRNKARFRNAPLITKVCEICGQEFSTKSKRAKTCSRKCAALLRWGDEHTETRTCPVCGKVFYERAARKKVCCSISCASKLKKAKQRNGQ